ncbi:MAG: helicase HerA-like domain-containing protein [Saprospiraceae bacterium]|nr:helicase HerA-like domain-containing protein [Saprospiraceae bacterium]
MTKHEKFLQEMQERYQFEGESIILGAAMLDGEYMTETFVRLPLRTFNRHGLIAGATGTGKTKTLQIIAEQLSAKGVPSLVMDIKGDLSGVAVESAGHPKIDQRHERIGLPFIPDTSPVEFLTLSDEQGVRLRATVSEFGPVLFSKMLGLNETQEGIVAVLFKYCDDHDLPLLDLKDFKKVLQYSTMEGKEEIEMEYGRISSASVGAIMRRIVELEQQGGDLFFGERSLDIDDLMRTDRNGKGVINILRLTDIQDRPKLFSTFMLQILAEIYTRMPEEGDLDKPKFVFFIDEAHLVFEEASDALMDQIEVIVKLIRSKGVGIFFITQNPTDIPEEVLSQLGMKIQHALRAFTAKDRRNIRLTAENYPLTEFYQTDQLLTKLGIGEALVTALNDKGIPTPLVHTYLRAPQSRMDILTPGEIDAIISRSQLIDKYNEEIDRESAYEILGGKIEAAREEAHRDEMHRQRESGRRTSRRREKSIWESTTTRQIGRTVARELTRGLLGVLGVKTTRRRRRSSIKLPW